MNEFDTKKNEIKIEFQQYTVIFVAINTKINLIIEAFKYVYRQLYKYKVNAIRWWHQLHKQHLVAAELRISLLSYTFLTSFIFL